MNHPRLHLKHYGRIGKIGVAHMINSSWGKHDVYYKWEWKAVE